MDNVRFKSCTRWMLSRVQPTRSMRAALAFPAKMAFLFAFGNVFSCDSRHTDVANTTQSIIYGADDRVEAVHAREDLRAVAAQAVLAVMPLQWLREQANGSYTVDAPSVGEHAMLCSGESFAHQPAAAACTGVLVARDTVATSGHCVASDGSCPDARFVFGYAINGDDPGQTMSFPASAVFRCDEVIARQLSGPDDACQWDVALVRLDREVGTMFKPVAMRARPARTGESVHVIGFPAGAPAKVDSGAHVVDDRASSGDYFTLNSDTFFASSGSPVLDDSAQLIGMLVRGGTDFEWDAGAACNATRWVPDPSQPRQPPRPR